LRDSFNDDDSEHRPAKMDVTSANAPSVKRIEVDFHDFLPHDFACYGVVEALCKEPLLTASTGPTRTTNLLSFWLFAVSFICLLVSSYRSEILYSAAPDILLQIAPDS
jgi:hypothetical protein